MTRRRDLFDALRDPDRRPLRGVIHSVVIADLADHDITGVEPDPETKVKSLCEAQLIGESAQLIPCL